MDEAVRVLLRVPVTVSVSVWVAVGRGVGVQESVMESVLAGVTVGVSVRELDSLRLREREVEWEATCVLDGVSVWDKDFEGEGLKPDSVSDTVTDADSVREVAVGVSVGVFDVVGRKDGV